MWPQVLLKLCLVIVVVHHSHSTFQYSNPLNKFLPPLRDILKQYFAQHGPNFCTVFGNNLNGPMVSFFQ